MSTTVELTPPEPAEAIAETTEAAETAIVETAEAATEAIAETAEAEAQPSSSSHASELAEIQAEQMVLTQRNIDLMFRRVDQTVRLLESTIRLLESTGERQAAVTSEMLTTMQLMQELIGQQDERQENLAVIAAALTKAMSRLRVRRRSTSSTSAEE